MKGILKGETSNMITQDNESVSATKKRKCHPIATVTPTKLHRSNDELDSIVEVHEGCKSVVSLCSSSSQSIQSNVDNNDSCSNLIMKLIQIEMSLHKLTQESIKAGPDIVLYHYLTPQINDKELCLGFETIMQPLTFSETLIGHQSDCRRPSQQPLSGIKLLTKDIERLFCPKCELSTSLVELYLSW